MTLAGERGVDESDGTGETINFAKLVCGSEGTLAVVTEVTVRLEPVPEIKNVALLAIDDAIAVVLARPLSGPVQTTRYLTLPRCGQLVFSSAGYSPRSRAVTR